MKKLLVLCFALILLFIPVFVFAASCESSEDEYFIKFTFEGEEYTCSFGHPLSDIEVPYAAVTPTLLAQVQEEELIKFYGSTVETETLWEDHNFYIQIDGYLAVNIPESYTGEYTLGERFTYIRLWVYDDPDNYLYYAFSGTVTIDVFNEIGASVEGSFNAIFTLGGDAIALPQELGDEPQTVTGSFRIKRVSEEDLPIPEIN